MEQLLAAGAIDLHTTYFETVTAMALLVFAEEAVDIVVLEVGLGGRLDATNVVTPELCVITPIDFDHEPFSGRSLEAIAGEKAGHSQGRRAGGLRAPAPRSRRRARPARRAALHSGGAHRGVDASTIWSSTPRGSRFLLSGELEFASSARSPASTRWRMPPPPPWR